MAKDVIDLITADHRKVDGLFEQLKSGKGDRSALAHEVERLLLAHSRAEEEQVYPVVVADGHEEAAEIRHSEKEHHEAAELARQLSRTDPKTKKFDELVDKLAEAVTHHVETEESQVLPALRDAVDAARLADLADRFTHRKEEILQRFGPQGQSAEEATKGDLYGDAQAAGMPGRSKMNKDELGEALQKRGRRQR